MLNEGRDWIKNYLRAEGLEDKNVGDEFGTNIGEALTKEDVREAHSPGAKMKGREQCGEECLVRTEFEKRKKN
ncbi:hypothetical protein SUGI_0446970 [Cryptomeria japonica]|nr:hypothetical protein SUGI_0446970 [Cryptomeria japonica]